MGFIVENELCSRQAFIPGKKKTLNNVLQSRHFSFMFKIKKKTRRVFERYSDFYSNTVGASTIKNTVISLVPQLPNLSCKV